MSKGFKPTAQQQAILDAFRTSDPMIVNAGAGTGKTTTLQMLAEDTYDIGLYIAFNRTVAAEAKQRFPDTVDCMTAHALAKRTLEKDDYWADVIRAKFSPSTSLSGKAIYDQIIAPVFPHGTNYFDLHPSLKIDTGMKDRRYLYYANWGQLVSGTVKSFCQSADDELTVKHFNAMTAAPSINKHFPYVVAKQLAANRAIVETTVILAKKYWDRATDVNDREVAFGFDHILKAWQLSRPYLDYDFILFDEAQDANETLSHVVMEQHRKGTQVIVVGDRNQAIYGFTGSLDAMEKFSVAAPNAAVLPLTESWRFGEPVATAANQVLRIKGVPERISGLGKDTEPLVEEHIGVDYVEEGIDAILCRSNSGCLDAAFNILKEHPEAKIKVSVNITDLKDFYVAARDFQLTGKTKYATMKDYKSYDEFVNAVENDVTLGMEFGMLLNIAKASGGIHQALALVERVENASRFNGEPDVTITTIHQAKGAEWDNVLLYDDWMRGISTDEEKNLLYVAATRAKKRLYTGGFWTVFVYGIHLTAPQVESLLNKTFITASTSTTEESLLSEMSPTMMITEMELGTNADGTPKFLEYPASIWGRGADATGIRVHGCDMVYRTAYMSSSEFITIDESFLSLERGAIDSMYENEVQRDIAHLCMDARESLEIAQSGGTLRDLGTIIHMTKGALRDETGKIATFMQEAKGFETPEDARRALIAAMLDSARRTSIEANRLKASALNATELRELETASAF
jgi:hypothetical protein